MHLENHTLLYVEDEIQIQKNISEYLVPVFKEIYLAATAQEGMASYLRHRPDALLLDINLPDKSGLTLAQEIRQKDSEIPIIMLTAYADQEKLFKAIDLNVFKYLLKPIDPQTFDDTLKLLGKKLSMQQQKICTLDETYYWEVDKHRLWHEDKEVALTTKEALLIDLLLQHRGHSVSFEEIMAYVWAEAFEREVSYNCVKNIVSSLRKKLPEGCIKSVYGSGYILS